MPLFLPLLLVAAGRAAEPEDDPLPDFRRTHAADESTRIYRGGTAASTAGLVMGGAGLAVAALGVASDQPTTGLIGAVVFVLGPPFVAGGSLRARRGLVFGGQEVSAAPGAIAWGCWAGAFVAARFGDPYDSGTQIATMTLLLGSYGAGIAQMAINRGAFHAHDADLLGRRIELAPLVLDGHSGVALTGTF